MSKIEAPVTTQEIIEKIKKKGPNYYIAMTAMGGYRVVVNEALFKDVRAKEGDDFFLTVQKNNHAFIKINGYKIVVRFESVEGKEVPQPAVSEATIKTIENYLGFTYITTEELGEDILSADTIYSELLIEVRPGDKFKLIGYFGDFYMEIKDECVPVNYLDVEDE